MGLFKVIDKNENEVLLGETNKHLDFRTLFNLIKSPVGNSYVFTLTALVRFHIFWGKVYFTVIKPFYTIIVQTIIKSIAKKVISDKNISS